MLTEKSKLMTVIEKMVHKHIEEIREATHDFVVLYLRRNGITIDENQLGIILSTVKNAIDSEHMNRLESFAKELSKQLDSYIVKENG